jgi:hypothetical protein
MPTTLLPPRQEWRIAPENFFEMSSFLLLYQQEIMKWQVRDKVVAVSLHKRAESSKLGYMLLRRAIFVAIFPSQRQMTDGRLLFPSAWMLFSNIQNPSRPVIKHARGDPEINVDFPKMAPNACLNSLCRSSIITIASSALR